MIFSSTLFLFWFLPLVLFVYYLVKPLYRNSVLLLFSLFFYGWGEGEKIAIMLVSTLINYLSGIIIEKSKHTSKKRMILGVGIGLNLVILLFYKYSNFFADNYNLAADALGFDPLLWEHVILPLGISFYTFHGISYMIDVFRGHASAQKNPFDLALYISFFPQLIAGPIVRYKDLASQLSERKTDTELFASGVKRFVLGLSKKVLIANLLGPVPEMVFRFPQSELNPYWSWLAIFSATIQVYLDFSGYSDMAIGLARMFGFSFKENFIYPFTSQSMKEFWTRWHISLSSWFKDYVYIPLGGSRNGTLRTYLNMIFVFLLTGFWHGASWSFILFGAFHGFLIIFERLGFDKLLMKLNRILRSVYVFFVTSLSIIFFSIDDLHKIGIFYKSLFQIKSQNAYNDINLLLTTEWYIVLAVGLCVSTPVVEFLFSLIKNVRASQWLQNFLIVLLLILCIARMSNSTYNPFIYFRF